MQETGGFGFDAAGIAEAGGNGWGWERTVGHGTPEDEAWKGRNARYLVGKGGKRKKRFQPPDHYR